LEAIKDRVRQMEMESAKLKAMTAEAETLEAIASSESENLRSVSLNSFKPETDPAQGPTIEEKLEADKR